MKKLLWLMLVAVLLVGCGKLTHEEKVANVATDVNVQVEINELQGQLDRGEITEKYARERLAQILRERKADNSEKTEDILKKMERTDPESAAMFREILKQRAEVEWATKTE